MKSATLFSATLGEDGKFEPPLGPLYIAAVLEDLGCEVDFRDYQLADGASAYDPSHICEFLKGHRQILLVSCFVDMLPVVIGACRLIKQKRPDTVIILGGPGPTAKAHEILQTFPWLDGIVRGEGEDTICEWASTDWSRLSGAANSPVIAGMVYRRADVLIDGPARGRIMDSDGLPLPAYHLLDWNRYNSARVITTRGCPYHCSFCDVAPLWDRKAVFRDLYRTIDEMMLLRDRYGQSGVAIVDDTFVLNRNRVQEFCQILIDTDAKIQWGCFGRINLMTEELIELMARAGCRGVFYGIDSGSTTILNRTLKQLKASTILPTLKLSAQYFDRIEASFIWGYPFETLEDFQMTLELAGEASRLAPKVNVQMHMLSPLPSAPIFLEFDGKLLRPEPADAAWLLLPNLLLDERAVAIKDIIECAPQLFPGFFTFPTPDKEIKRAYLEQSMRSLDHTIGLTIFDDQVNGLLDSDDQETETRLLNGAGEPAERIGIGLALGLLRRTRRRSRDENSTGLEIVRGPALTRQRNDAERTQ